MNLPSEGGREGGGSFHDQWGVPRSAASLEREWAERRVLQSTEQSKPLIWLIDGVKRSSEVLMAGPFSEEAAFFTWLPTEFRQGEQSNSMTFFFLTALQQRENCAHMWKPIAAQPEPAEISIAKYKPRGWSHESRRRCAACVPYQDGLLLQPRRQAGGDGDVGEEERGQREAGVLRQGLLPEGLRGGSDQRGEWLVSPSTVASLQTMVLEWVV